MYNVQYIIKLYETCGEIRNEIHYWKKKRNKNLSVETKPRQSRCWSQQREISETTIINMFDASNENIVII